MPSMTLLLTALIGIHGLVSADAIEAERLYGAACAGCHGIDGAGSSRERVGFEEQLPDFTDCSFATREPDVDWIAVAHEGGPVRGFARMMPSFGQAMKLGEIELAVSHIRTFCPDPAWPRGELNLPRALITEKAYPEDEAVWTAIVNSDGAESVTNKFVYEKRFGARNQVELIVPYGWRDVEQAAGGSSRAHGIGDVAVGVKRVLHHSIDRGSIFSVTGEVIFPTGDEDDGLGKGTAVVEPFLTWGRLLSDDAFLQVQFGAEFPTESGHDDEAFLRTVVGKSYTQGRFGRVWSPMLEILGARDPTGGATAHWDLLPEVQVTLNTRQHIMANIGVRMPVNDTSGRETQVLVYVLWDWFDGSLFAGW